ncbi:unnamed protein product [Clonostachys byssicola]|uniref:Uncharacterized protein n=1 Tax=Clonostachys byssicola TaxID=160290 RepID=A0A9N9UDV1_9HYPO|nr:unnamed protein product [Clonostachys byssicola]
MSIFSYFRQDGAKKDVKTSHKATDIQRFLNYTASSHLNSQVSASSDKRQCDAFENAPLFSLAAQTAAEELSCRMSNAQLIPQYGLIGTREDVDELATAPEDQLIMANMNVPWSAFICGSQGAGKSHTLSCLLEACLIHNNPTGTLSHPMAGLVFHFDKFTSGSATQICEAAYLCSAGIPVKVLVAPSNIWNMDRMYRDVPGIAEERYHLQVVPLYLDDSKLSISTMLKLMAFDSTGSGTPLYMEVVTRIIREISMEGSHFTYSLFKDRLSATKLFRDQETALNMRLQLLDTFLTPELTPHLKKPSAAEQDIWDFQPGTLTIVDLSDPFLSSGDACSLFSICLSIFLEERSNCSRVVALDEAHKFMTQSGAANVLTEDLTSVIRQQRHISTRVFIATQEPTLSPTLIDLSNATFVHRFSSPAWFRTLKGHLTGAMGKCGSASPQQELDVFQSITELQTGEALVFCPTAQTRVLREKDTVINKSLGSRFMRIIIRKRVTFDGGVSLVATATPHATRPSHQIKDGRIKMHNPVSRISEKEKQNTSNSNTLPLTQHDRHAQTKIDIPDRSLHVANPQNKRPSSNQVASSSLLTSHKPNQAKVVTSNKVKVESRKQFISLANRYADRLAEEKSWDHSTRLIRSERQSHLETFKTTLVQVQPNVCSDDEVKSIFFNAIGAKLVRHKLIFETKRLGLMRSMQVKLRTA